MRMRRCVLASMTLFGVACLEAQAGAATIYTWAEVQSVSDSSASGDASAAYADTTGDGSASAQFGTLKAEWEIYNMETALQIWHAESGFVDSFTVTSSTLPVGTLVTLGATLDYSGSWVGTAGAAGGRPLSFGRWGISLQVKQGTGTLLSLSEGWYNGGTTGTVSSSESGTFNVRVGDSFALISKLGIDGYTWYWGTFIQDFGNTGEVFLSGPDGVTLVSQSGHDYRFPTSSVPEPALLALLGLASAGVARRARRCR